MWGCFCLVFVLLGFFYSVSEVLQFHLKIIQYDFQFAVLCPFIMDFVTGDIYISDWFRICRWTILKTMTGNNVEKQYCYEAVKKKKKAILCNGQMCLHVVLPILSWLLPVGITRRQRSYVSVSFSVMEWNFTLTWLNFFVTAKNNI